MARGRGETICFRRAPSVPRADPAAMPATIGQPLTRKEDLRLLTGAGRFSDDVNLPGQAYGAAVRSPHAHALIRAIDVAAADSGGRRGERGGDRYLVACPNGQRRSPQYADFAIGVAEFVGEVGPPAG